MKYILVFTKPASLNSVNASFANRTDIRPLSLANPVLQFDEGTELFKGCKGLDSEGLYFVFDGIAGKDLAALLAGQNEDCIYVLKHKKPEFEFTVPQSHIADGRHAPRGKHYSATVKILSDKEWGKTKRIFEAVFKADPILEAKLELLQRVLSGETAIEVDVRIKPLQAEIDTFLLTAKDRDVFSAEYQQAFRCLRDAMGIE